jgi:hypothetical protein
MLSARLRQLQPQTLPLRHHHHHHQGQEVPQPQLKWNRKTNNLREHVLCVTFHVKSEIRLHQVSIRTGQLAYDLYGVMSQLDAIATHLISPGGTGAWRHLYATGLPSSTGLKLSEALYSTISVMILLLIPT